MELRDDLLKGAASIAEYIGESPRRTFYLLEHGQIPGFKCGGRWNLRKSSMIRYIEKLEAEALAEREASNALAS